MARKRTAKLTVTPVTKAKKDDSSSPMKSLVQDPDSCNQVMNAVIPSVIPVIEETNSDVPTVDENSSGVQVIEETTSGIPITDMNEKSENVVEEVPKKWSSLFDNRSRSEASELKFIPPMVKDGNRMVSFSSKDIAKEEHRWKNAIVGCVYGLYPKFERLNSFCNKVLGSGPFTFDQKPLMLKKWHPRMSMDPSEIRSVPIWIQLPGLPWEFWTADILSKIGSFCGKPLYSDQCTINKTKLGFARVLVEMDAMGPFPETVEMVDEDGKVFRQKIVYEWKPLICDKCCRMGHSKNNCRVTQNIKEALEKKVEIPDDLIKEDSVVNSIAIVEDKNDTMISKEDVQIPDTPKTPMEVPKDPKVSNVDKPMKSKEKALQVNNPFSSLVGEVNELEKMIGFKSKWGDDKINSGRKARLNSRMIDIDR
ncbi:uncharacterized protein LOC126668196 [Mercurialis annua]|uniref:uncharacterized protein LOC126668196 n=1 Tax=Mercurialis annua TaxID=3986 RepID=UPI0021601D62|nr:uncharacterized protein LOC126668196 [Mercurialis annua]